MRSALALLSLAAGCHPEPHAPGPTPALPANVLLILMDDTGQDKVSIYGVHPDPPQTPNIDALASHGMRFTQAWAYPMCSPTRAALLTGQHTRRYGIGDRLTPNVGKWELATGERLTLPQMLAQAPDRWDTSLVGKWHLSSGTLGDDALHHPNRHGFRWASWLLGNVYAALTDDVPAAERDYYSWEEIRNGGVSWKETYATSVVVDEAIERSREMAEPWLMWVGLPSVHDPLELPPAELYSGPEPTNDVEMLDAMVEAMDKEIGRLLAGIDPKLLARTNVVLMGDNGTTGFGIAPPLDPLRDKGTVYEGGCRVPLIVAGPAVAQPGSTSDALVHAVDLFPTVAFLAGVDTDTLRTPAGGPVVLDGHSWREVLADPRDPGSQTLYTEFFGPNGLGPYTFTATAVRDADYKYIRLLDGTEELYQLGPEELSEGKDLLVDPDSLSDEALEEWATLSALLDQTMTDLQ